MDKRIFLRVAGTIFLAIAALHVLRLGYGWEALIGTLAIPFWVSWIAAAIAGIMAYQAFRLGKE